MKYFEFGQEHPELMVMLPGGGVCYRGALPVAEEMAKTYHVVLLAYDGFNPDEPETKFISVPDEARRLGDYIVEHYGGKIAFPIWGTAHWRANIRRNFQKKFRWHTVKDCKSRSHEGQRATI